GRRPTIPHGSSQSATSTTHAQRRFISWNRPRALTHVFPPPHPPPPDDVTAAGGLSRCEPPRQGHSAHRFCVYARGANHAAVAPRSAWRNARAAAERRALRTCPLSRNDSARFRHSSLATTGGTHRASRNRFEGRPAMTGMYDQVRPGIGHNQPDEYAEEKKHEKWERWAKKRTFVRALEGTYSHLYKALLEEKRVYPSRDVPWKGGP